ncbi:MAG: hypothetical protein M4D80_08880, partial [Myxococcota bacterium]|nr:hypothetical protein [Myxococcota bacterium]
MTRVILVLLTLVASGGPAYAQGLLCPPAFPPGGTATIAPTAPGGVRFVARIEDPPRTRVTLSIDNEKGNHFELVWDPVTQEGLQQEVLLPTPNIWRLTPSSEYERIQADSAVYTYETTFHAAYPDPKTNEIVLEAKSTVSASGGNPSTLQAKPKIKVGCRPAQSELSQMILDKRKVASVAKARGLLNQSVPEPVQSALTVLAEIALDRAKSGAMSLVRDKFIVPMCEKLDFERLGLLQAKGRVLPRTCTMLENLRLQDVLSSGRGLLAAIETDVKETLLPAVIAHLPRLNEQGRMLARIGLDLASRVVDGQPDGAVEVDYLITLFDQSSWASGFDQDVERVQKWASTLVPTVPRFIMEVTLPDGFDAPIGINQRPWGKIPECKPTEVHATIAGTIEYTSANRDKCVTAIVNAYLSGPNWLQASIDRKLFTLYQAIAAVRGLTKQSLGDWLQARWKDEVTAWLGTSAGRHPDGTPKTLRDYVHEEVVLKLPPLAQSAVEASCASRLIIGIAKWCSSQESCAAGEVAAILKNPTKVFLPSNELPWAMCWKNDIEYRLPAEIDRYIDLGVRLVSFLSPPHKGEERQRILAMVRWLFDVVTRVATEDKEQLSRVHDIIKHLLEKDYVNAFTASLGVASEIRWAGKMPVEAKKALELIGAVASYARTYEETKGLDV